MPHPLFPPAAAGPRPARVVVVQDRPRSIPYQRDLLQRLAAQHGVAVEVAALDLRQPVADNVDALAAVADGVDWLITDLLIDNVDQAPETSRGIVLLRELVSRHMFGGYVHQPRPGVRGVAISSACVDHGTVFLPELRFVLDQLGVRHEFLGRGGDFEPLARSVVRDLHAANGGGRAAES